MLSLEQLRFLSTAAAQELLAADLPDDALGAQTTLRKRCSAEQAMAVVQLRTLRRRAAAGGRFPAEFAARMLATDKMLQQASSWRMASYVGAQLAKLSSAEGGTAEVWDLCCGMGSDSMGIARASVKVRGVDVDPRAVFCATHNASITRMGGACSFEAEDVESLKLPPDAAVHIDPDRRSASSRRAVQLADCRPGPEFLQKLIANVPCGAVKLSPALSFHVLTDWPGVSQEYVSEQGVCRQLIVWWGSGGGREKKRRATVISGDLNSPQTVSIEADEGGLADLGQSGQWIIEPDPAVIAAEAVDSLARMIGARRFDASVAWVLADQPSSTPLAKSYHVLAETPGRRADVAKMVRKLGGGPVHVKTRGLSLDTDILQRQLSGKGQRRLLVFWCKTGHSQRTFITETPLPG